MYNTDKFNFYIYIYFFFFWGGVEPPQSMLNSVFNNQLLDAFDLILILIII